MPTQRTQVIAPTKVRFTFVGSDGTFQGYASRWGVSDYYQDRILKGAFAKSIEKRGARGVKLFHEHDPAEPLGVWTELTEDDTGLLAKGQLDMNVQRAREIASLMRSGGVDGLSVGFDLVEYEENDIGGLDISEADLFEISVVAMPALENAQVDSLELSDTYTLDGLKLTADGYMTASVRAARTGIQLYRGREVGRPDLDVVRVYRPEGEVFDKDSMKSYAHRPVTNDHPPEAVNAQNWKKYAVGAVGDKIARDGEHVQVPLVLMDKAMIEEVRRGKRELSLGYTTDLKWGSGKTPAGEDYDAVQTRIRANHLAVVTAARGGKKLRIGDDQPLVLTDEQVKELFDKYKEPAQEKKMPDMKTLTVDGLPVEMTDMAARVVEKHIDGLTKSIESLKAKLAAEEEANGKTSKAKDDALAVIATKDAEITTLKKQLEDAKPTPVVLDAMVVERTAVIGKAKAVLGDKLITDGKTDDDIRKQVVDAKLGDSAKGWNADMIKASFNTLTADVKAPAAGADPMARAIGAGITVGDARATAYAERDKSLANAWRNQSQTTN